MKCPVIVILSSGRSSGPSSKSGEHDDSQNESFENLQSPQLHLDNPQAP